MQNPVTALPAALLTERLARLLQNDAHSAGLKPTQWDALRYLARANRFSRSPGALTAYLGTTKGTVSQTVQALERKGLVRKQISETDRRGVTMDLTAAGWKLLRDDPLSTLNAALAGLPAAQVKALEATLQATLAAMLTARGGQPFGACHTCLHFRRDHTGGAPHYCSLLNEPLNPDDSSQICIENKEPA